MAPWLASHVPNSLSALKWVGCRRRISMKAVCASSLRSSATSSSARSISTGSSTSRSSGNANCASSSRNRTSCARRGAQWPVAEGLACGLVTGLALAAFAADVRRPLSADSPTSCRLLLPQASVPAVFLVKGHADAFFLAPDHPAGPLLAIDHQHELGRDSELACDIQRRAGLGNVSDGAIDRAAAEMNSAAFQHAMSACDPVFVLVHPLTSQNVEIPAFRVKPLKAPGTSPLTPENDQVARRLVDAFFTAGSRRDRPPRPGGPRDRNIRIDSFRLSSHRYVTL